MWPSVIILGLVAAAFGAVVVSGIRNKKKGKGGCTCGGSCGACGMGCHTACAVDGDTDPAQGEVSSADGEKG